ncbi:MAG: hypothetical protein AAGU78_06825 [Chloroflexota bacterium]
MTDLRGKRTTVHSAGTLRRARWLCFRLALIAAGLLLAACGVDAQPVIVTQPPSATWTPSATATETLAVAAPPAETPPPARPASTRTPGPPAAFPLVPTVPPAPETLTATAAPTRLAAAIRYFTTDSEFVTPGENVTLFWSVDGADRARIYRVDEDGERLFRWDVMGEGQITVATRATDREAARFLLTAQIGQVEIEQLLPIPLRCVDIWFFDPPPDACAAAPAELTTEAEQTFERGRMVWVAALDRIYVVFEDGARPGWAMYPDEFNEGDPERDESLAPPPGLEQPIRGFGLVWRNNPRVRERLGWGVSPEVSFEGMMQADSAEPRLATLYLRLRDGGILALDAQTNEWDVLVAAGSPES